MSSLTEKSVEYVKSRIASFDGGHDWMHIERVLHLAVRIQKEEKKGDPEIIQLATIFHDIADTKFHQGSEEDGGNIACDFLVSEGYDIVKAQHVRQIINNISFKKTFGSQEFDSIELQIVRDADRLDAIGAIGIARAFNYGGYKNRALWDPERAPEKYNSVEAYKKSDAPTINHFYEKLFLLKDLMHTDTAKKMAEERHRYMEEFVSRFKEEWEGKI